MEGHGTKGTGVNRMPWCETVRKWVNRTLRWLGYLWPWIFKVKLYLGSGRSDCHGTKGMGVDRMPWCKTQLPGDLKAEDTVRDRGDLRCRLFHRRRTRLVNAWWCIYMHQWTGSAFVQLLACCCSATGQYLNKCWFLVSWRILNQNTFSSIIPKVLVILLRPQC